MPLRVRFSQEDGLAERPGTGWARGATRYGIGSRDIVGTFTAPGLGTRRYGRVKALAKVCERARRVGTNGQRAERRSY